MGKLKDINVNIAGINFVCRACAVIINNDKILFQKKTNDKYWALPGGKIEVGETTSETLKRELNEELGINDFEVQELISITENFFKFNDNNIHQYIFTHRVMINDDRYNDLDEFDGVENGNVIFKWIKFEALKTEKIKPNYVINQLINMDGNIKFETCIEN